MFLFKYRSNQSIDLQTQKRLQLQSKDNKRLKKAAEVLTHIEKFNLPQVDIMSLQSLMDSKPNLLIDSKTIQVDLERGEIVGKGGSGIVMKAKMGNETVAVKMVQEQMAGDSIKETMERELVMLAKVDNHPSILRFYGITFYDMPETEVPVALIVTEFCPLDLKKYIYENGLIRDVTKFKELVRGINDGVQHIHNLKVAHCDLKPDNILLDKENKPKICDMGLAVNINEKNHNTSGTPGYKPPEMIANNFTGFYDKRCWDIFSMAMIYYFLFAGRHPLADKCENPFEIHDEISNGTRPEIPTIVIKPIRRIIQKMWEQDFTKRITMEKVISLLGEVRVDEPNEGLVSNSNNFHHNIHIIQEDQEDNFTI